MMNGNQRKILITLVVFLSWASLSIARYGGPGYLQNSAASGAPGEIHCGACHGGSTAAGSSLALQVIQGPNQYQANTFYKIRATLTSLSAQVGGIQVSAVDHDSTAGSWTVPSSMRNVSAFLNNGTVRNYAEHRSPQPVGTGTNGTLQNTISWTFDWTSPSTKNLNPTFYAAAVAGNNDFSPSGDQVLLSQLSLGSLPVTWGSFEVAQREDGTLLSWSTLTETQSDHFVIERSIDGGIFSDIGTVTAALESDVEQSYSFEDSYISESNVRYYRLRQVDVNGQFAYSEVKTVVTESGDSRILQVYPTLLSSGTPVHIQYSNLGESTVPIILMTINGQAVGRSQIPPQGVHEIQVSTDGLIPGVYTLIMGEGQQAEARKLLIR